MQTQGREAHDGTRARQMPTKPKVPLWLCYHEAGHAVARLALDQDEPHSGPMIRRAVVRRRENWMDLYQTEKGVTHDDICGIVEMDARALHGIYTDLRNQPEMQELAAGAAHALWLDAVECLAGPIAEGQARRMGQLATCIMRVGSEDLRDARRKLEELGRANAFNDAFKEAWTLMRRQRAAVRALALALQERLVLDGEEVEAIVADLLVPSAKPEASA